MRSVSVIVYVAFQYYPVWCRFSLQVCIGRHSEWVTALCHLLCTVSFCLVALNEHKIVFLTWFLSCAVVHYNRNVVLNIKFTCLYRGGSRECDHTPCNCVVGYRYVVGTCSFLLHCWSDWFGYFHLYLRSHLICFKFHYQWKWFITLLPKCLKDILAIGMLWFCCAVRWDLSI